MSEALKPGTSLLAIDGGFAIVDTVLLSMVDGRRWRRNRSGYAFCDGDLGEIKLLHHTILPRKAGFQTDHINGDRLDNRMCNLRYATIAQNAQNRIKKPNAKVSPYKGVRPYPRAKNWSKNCKRLVAVIYPGRRIKYLGYFRTQEEAARAYDVAARKLYGAFAKTNFPSESDTVNRHAT